jgi:hypothetical protein
MFRPNRRLLSLAVCLLASCQGDRGPQGPQGVTGPSGTEGPQGPSGPALGYLEDNRVVFERSELSVINPAGVLLNLVATQGPVGIRFYKDFGFGNEQQTNPWHMGFIEGLTGYQGLAILRDWLFTSALWDADGRLTVGRLDPYPPANQPTDARFEVRGTVDEVQARVTAPEAQSAQIFQIVSGAGTQGTTRFAVDAVGNTIIGSPSSPREIILYDTADGAPYSLRITNGQLSITRVG